MQLATFPLVGMPELPNAACRDVTDPEVFFPVNPAGRPTRDDRDDVRIARRVCTSCPERRPCLEWALTTGEPFGVYGGMTAAERQRLLHPGRNVIAVIENPPSRDDYRADLEAALPCTARTAAHRAGVRLSVAIRVLVDYYDRQGLGARDIADRLDITARTVVRYRAMKAA